ncbi:MAG: TIGR03936 family radical SAM-associated protein [Actinomycetota bacterium]|nr:TIGR03936 family radical SAM-associated protein [Actinomycetota bacterium]
MAPGEFRLRLCCGKRGRLRFLSHLEYSHAIERGARRAGLPYAVTQGFSPHMKLAFGPALPVGTEGEREYVDVWLTRYLPVAEVIESLAASLAPELAPAEAIYVGDKDPSLGAACTIGVYEVDIRGGGVTESRVREALDEVVSEGELRVEHKGKNKVFDLAISLPKGVMVESCGAEGVKAAVVTRMGQNGSLRPDALVAYALSRSGITGAVTLVTRLDTLIEEEGEFRRPV